MNGYFRLVVPGRLKNIRAASGMMKRARRGPPAASFRSDLQFFLKGDLQCLSVTESRTLSQPANIKTKPKEARAIARALRTPTRRP